MCRRFLHMESCFCWTKRVSTCWFSGNRNKNTEVYLYAGGQDAFQNDIARLHAQLRDEPSSSASTGLSNPVRAFPPKSTSASTLADTLCSHINTKRLPGWGAPWTAHRPTREVSSLNLLKMLYKISFLKVTFFLYFAV